MFVRKPFCTNQSSGRLFRPGGLPSLQMDFMNGRIRAAVGSKHKAKFKFTDENNSLLYLAGISQVVEIDEVMQERFAILTTCANESVSLYHNRMPVLLHRDEVDSWVLQDGFEEYMYRVPAELDVKLVGSDRVSVPVDSV
jgi:putative SOS response-associated peptidase YedK